MSFWKGIDMSKGGIGCGTGIAGCIGKSNPYHTPRDPMAGEKLLKQIKEAELKKAKEQADKEKAKLGFGDPLKNKKWLVYGLIAVAGYFAYKKFKK